jgi:hypothetical protein
VIPRQLLIVLGAAVEPLEAAATNTDVLDGVLADVGVAVALTDGQREQIVELAGLGVFAGIGELVASTRAGDGLGPAEIARLTDAVGTAVAAFTAVRDGDTDLSTLPAPLDVPAAWTDVVDRLPDALLSRAVEGLASTLSGVLAAIGVLRVDAGSDGLPGRRWIDWGLLDEIIGGDWRGVASAYRWGAPGFDPTATLDVIADVAGRFGLDYARDALDIEVIGARYASCDLTLRQLELTIFAGSTGAVAGAVAADVVPVPAVGGDRLTPTGFLIVNRSSIDAAATIDVADNWQLEVSGAVGADVVPSVELQPGAPPAILGGSGGAGIVATLAGAPAGELPWLLVGERDGIRVELAAVGISATLALDDPAISITAELEGLRLTTETSGADSFVATVLGLIPIDIAGDVAVEWSTGGTLAFRGSGALEIPIGGTLELGPVRIGDTRLSVELGGNLAIVANGTVTLTIADVFEASIIGIGLRVEIGVDAAGAAGSAGGLDVDVEFVPPHRVEFALDAGPVTGEGFVDRTDDRYVGGLVLDVLAVGIDAFTIIDTSLPGDPDGFALFATLSLRFPSIPLGFGFSLSGLGGLLALNRSVDTEALALGLRDGAADAILFPENVLRDADVLVSQIDAYFPLQDGNTVVGPVAEIRWGVGDLLIGQLGVAVSLPQAVVVVLASIEAALPDRDAPILELHLDVLGVLDVEEGSLLIVGSLYDSRLLGVIELSGDSALYVSWGNDPYFVLSVGGFHPGFTPPAHVPAILEDLRPMRAEVLVGVGVTAAIEAYFAVTSNTVQFGGGFELEASADFLLVTYTARGWFEFDVLLRFAPFLILAEASAGVGVYANDKELLGVSLTVHLEGPQPWYASGNARFKFFGIDVKFDFAVGGHAPPEPRGSSNVLDLVRLELANAASWSIERASGTPAGLLLAGAAADSLLRPDDTLVGRQAVAPLDRTLARFGETTPLQSEVSITSTRVVSMLGEAAGPAIGDLDVSDATDWFAPAQYDVMSESARLSSPSYELMTAGVRIGATAVEVPRSEEVRAAEGHETEVWEPTTNTSTRFEAVVISRSVADTVAASSAAATARSVRPVGVDVARIGVTAQAYVAADTTTGAHRSPAGPYAAALAAAAELEGARVIPVHAGVRTGIGGGGRR